MDLLGKVALVTGANRGIGRGCALELARAGADIAVNYRTHEGEANEVAAEVRAMGRRAIVLQADVADRKRDQEMVDETVAQLGRLDVLVANAAYSKRIPFLEMTEEALQRTLDVVVWGTFNCAQFAARQMVRQGQGGSIIVISSVHAASSFPNAIAYNTAKAGINHMARTMATEMTPHRIRVNVIEPGWTDTPGERTFFSEEQIAEWGRKLPWGRLGTSQEIGWGAAFLAGPKSEYITGTVLRIDGGFMLPRLGPSIQ
jgi:glucose 1-dehydrogenase